MTTSIVAMRPYAGETDLQAICDLLNLCDRVDHLDDSYDTETLRIKFTNPKVDLAEDLRLWEDDTGQLLGFGQLLIRSQRADTTEASGLLCFRVHPEARGDELNLNSEIIAWAEERMREVGRKYNKPAILRSYEIETNIERHTTLQWHGFEPARYFFMMEQSLDRPVPQPHLPGGFTLHHMAGDADIAAWVEAFNDSFHDHWNHHPTTVDIHRHWLTDPNYNPERDLIVIAPDGSIAAFCFCMVDLPSNARNNLDIGWILILGTRRRFRKIGLGRAALLAGLQRLQAEGLAIARLEVDNQNPNGALQFYESAGFQRVQTRIHYAKRLG